MNRDNGRYSKVSRRIWIDSSFRNLSQPKPCAAWLFMRLLTAPEATSLPGLFCAWSPGLASSLGWSNGSFLKAFAELENGGLAKADWKNGIVWIPNAIRHNEPPNTNVVVNWRGIAKELPECTLTKEALASIARHLINMGPEWIAAWDASAVRPDRLAKIHAVTRDLVQRRDRGCCRYCGQPVNWKDRRGPLGGTYDHVDPSGPGDETNVVVACRGCNSTKGSRTPEEAGLRLVLVHDLCSDLDPTQYRAGTQDTVSSKQEAGSRNQNPDPDSCTMPIQIRRCMTASWIPAPEIMASFDVAMIPRYASEEIVARCRSHFAGNSQDLRTDAEWNQACSKWVFRDWANPSKRPAKPSESLASKDAEGWA